jgi:hypothetical protein
MAGIARKVELYNLAYKLAWKYISEDHKRAQPAIALRLHDCIRRQLKEGARVSQYFGVLSMDSLPHPPVRAQSAAFLRNII